MIDIRKRRGTYTKVQILGRPGAKKKKSMRRMSLNLFIPFIETKHARVGNEFQVDYGIYKTLEKKKNEDVDWGKCTWRPDKMSSKDGSYNYLYQTHHKTFCIRVILQKGSTHFVYDLVYLHRFCFLFLSYRILSF